MAKFSITSPDGQTFEVNAPDGATESDAIAYVQKNFYKPAKQETNIDPSEGGSTLKFGPIDTGVKIGQGTTRFLAGAGKAMYDLGRGAGQMVGLVDQNDIDESKMRDAPLMNTGAGIAGNVVGNIATALPAMFVPGANTVSGASAAGGVLGALQPTATGDSRINNIGIGAIAGGAGQGLANAVGRAVQPVRSTLSGQDATLAAKAKQFMPLNAAQETGSKPLRWIDSALDNLPFTADKQAAQKLGQREAWQNQLMNLIGENSNTATASVMGSAKKRIGDQIEDISSRNTVRLAPTPIPEPVQPSYLDVAMGAGKPVKVSQPVSDFQMTLDRAASRLNEFSSEEAKGAIGKAQNLLDRAIRNGGEISGKEYQSTRSAIQAAVDQAKNARNSDVANTLRSIRSALDDAATSSISSTDKKAWDAARGQYRVMKQIEKSIDPVSGSISPKKLINEVTKQDKPGVLYGAGDQRLADLSRIGKKFIAENLPDSGTAQRSWYMNALQNPTAGIGGLLGFMHGGPIGAVGGAALGAGTPLAAQRALWSQAGKKYLSDGVIDAAKIQRLAPYGNAVSVGLLN